jgi:hypothetical protein
MCYVLFSVQRAVVTQHNVVSSDRDRSMGSRDVLVKRHLSEEDSSFDPIALLFHPSDSQVGASNISYYYCC